MLTCIKVSISNNLNRGGIEIKSQSTSVTLNNITSIKILRKEYTGSVWSLIYTVEVSSKNDLNFSLFDILTRSNTRYSYSFDVMSGSSRLESQIFDDIECWFDGLFIGNFEHQYFAFANCETETKRNTQVEYVTTLSGRTPYRVSNANTNYVTGKSSGLFFDLDANDNFTPDYFHKYSENVVDFLTDGSNKILKTNDGQMWYVSVDDVIDLPFHDRYLGKNEISFSWTEIGYAPLFGMVIDDE